MPDQPVTEPQDREEQEATGLRRPLGVRSSDGASAPAVEGAPQEKRKPREAVFELDDVQVSYGPKPAVRGVSFEIGKNEITALIGPSGCGKSTLIRCLNRMNDLIPTARVEGKVLYHGQDLYAKEVDAVEVRKRIGMVFQKPNPFPKSIYDNIAFGPRVLGMKGSMDEIVERALNHAALWDEVKDRLKTNAFGMSGGQQQRLCIARCLAVEPDVILMDEPCSALDPISTGKIEDLMMDLKREYSIVIVTHNMQQAARVSDKTAFFTVELDDEEHRSGRVVEFDDTDKIFTNPSDSAYGGIRHRQGGLACRRRLAATFRRSSSKLEEQALGGLDMVVDALDRALETVQHQDVELASMVISDDDRIDGRYLEVHQGVLSLLALQAPVAGDLRLVAAVLHIIKNMERMGDQCVNMAKLVPLAGHNPPSDERVLSHIQRMGEQARQQVIQSQAGLRAAERRAGAGPGPPRRRDRPAEPRGLHASHWRSATIRTLANGRCT